MSEYTHEIFRIERGVTKGSGSPMWKCQTRDGQTVNIFQHQLAERNTFELMVQAGYAAFSELEPGEVQYWRNHPIQVELVKDGQWWKLAAVEPRPKLAESDEELAPDVDSYRDRAQRLSNLLTTRLYEWRYWDTEMTGLQEDDEMVAASVVNVRGNILFDELICPRNPQKLLRPGKSGKTASDVNGITPDTLLDAMLTEDALVDLAGCLTGRVWVAYNAPFDVAALERECLRYNHPLIYALGIHDAMQIFAEYLGDWQPKYRSFRTVTLSEAARLLDLDPGQSHAACDDAMTTLEIIRAIADGKPIKE